ncbi:hypothetical protein SH1V18_33620 [Vallitalea longa]|uniref:Methyltransferase type 11 domain-containing protein n=1 Tax=Vallitalea longa TaxID=2936439 RepID=A0A9W5YCC6_9FIRM|nr:class I SAM-dependent methyltransferase [Vallitalea longa]GKX30882.1 hypothetical protein SH1V18_33620 [Vallitalea longa]
MDDFWDKIWEAKSYKDFINYIDLNEEHEWLKYFSKYNVKRVCDIACGFGTYSAILSANNYEVYGSDISKRAIKITKDIMENINLDYKNYKNCNVTNILFNDNMFDAIIAHSVLDHITYEDTKTAIKEFSRITKPNGIIYISFDSVEAEDKAIAHDTLDDGSMIYTEGKRKGMIFRQYTDEEIKRLLSKYEILFFNKDSNDDRNIIYKNNKCFSFSI